MNDDKKFDYLLEIAILRDERDVVSAEIKQLSEKRRLLTRKINMLESIVKRADRIGKERNEFYNR